MHEHILAAVLRGNKAEAFGKEFKRIAMRADKTDTSFKAMIYAVAALINSR